MNKRIALSVIIVILLAAGGGYALWSSDTVDTNPPEEAQQQSDEQNDKKRQEDEINKNAIKEKDDGSNKPETNSPQEEQTEQNQADHSVTASSWGQNNQSKEVYVNAKASNANSGTCTLLLNNDDKTVTTKAPLQQTPTGYYACALRIGRDKIPSAGMWAARVTLESNGTTSRSQKVEINIQ